jgi:hypothetical protein
MRRVYYNKKNVFVHSLRPFFYFAPAPFCLRIRSGHPFHELAQSLKYTETDRTPSQFGETKDLKMKEPRIIQDTDYRTLQHREDEMMTSNKNRRGTNGCADIIHKLHHSLRKLSAS